MRREGGRGTRRERASGEAVTVMSGEDDGGAQCTSHPYSTHTITPTPTPTLTNILTHKKTDV